MTTGNCPSCGAPIAFAIGTSEVVVCASCNSVVARSDRGYEDHGKVAGLIDTGSLLRVGASGTYRGQEFRITGRTQLRHQAGGVWDEWYAAMADGRWAWLAEAQGRFYVTFPVAADAPPYEALSLGARVLDDLVVAEIGRATLASAEGELPWTPAPGYGYDYADLTGPERRFATIDYSETPPLVFKGAEVTLQELGLAGERTFARAAVTRLNCTQCGGALELRAPDQAERIWCPYCGAGHDITAGKLQFFKKLKKKAVEPVIPLGSTGTIDGDAYVVAGFMQRAVRFDIDYFWTEYLLYNAEKGYRWLVHSDGHWSFVTPLRPGEVADANPEGVAKHVYYDRRVYRLFQDATARVTYVLGEFYWKVAVGENVDTVDYVSPPFGISKEITRAGAREIHYSHARYLNPREVEKMFGIDRLERPSGIGPMQPFPGADLRAPFVVMLALLLLTAMFLGITLPGRLVHHRTYDLGSFAAPEGGPDNARVVFSAPFDLTGEHNVEVRASAAPLDNAWVYVALDLVEEGTGKMQSIELPLEYYSGVENGERWSEGSKSRRRFLSRPDQGRHVVRMEAQWEAGKPPPQVELKVREGVFRGANFLLALLGISLLPALTLFRKLSFESQRWKESAHSPFAALQGDGEEEE